MQLISEYIYDLPEYKTLIECRCKTILHIQCIFYFLNSLHKIGFAMTKIIILSDVRLIMANTDLYVNLFLFGD